jgi:hypothetical protein
MIRRCWHLANLGMRCQDPQFWIPLSQQIRLKRRRRSVAAGPDESRYRTDHTVRAEVASRLCQRRNPRCQSPVQGGPISFLARSHSGLRVVALTGTVAAARRNNFSSITDATSISQLAESTNEPTCALGYG